MAIYILVADTNHAFTYDTIILSFSTNIENSFKIVIAATLDIHFAVKYIWDIKIEKLCMIKVVVSPCHDIYKNIAKDLQIWLVNAVGVSSVQ